MQPVAEVARGDLLFGVGASMGADRHFPLSGLTGDLLSLGQLGLSWAPADRALLEIRGDLYRRLSVDRRGPSSVPLEPEAREGSPTDVGDFRVGLTLAPLGGALGASAGGRLEVTLPNTDERKGIGTNTTDVRLSLLGGYGAAEWRVTADVGVAILEAPLEPFEQNDVLVYAGELLWRAAPPLRLSLGVDGRASTRDRVPLGTEDRGEAQFGGELTRGRWAADARLGLGYARGSPEWSVVAGGAFRIRPGRPAPAGGPPRSR